MKKIIFIFMVILVVFLFTGCEEKQTETETEIIMDLLCEGKFDEAKEKIYKFYADDPDMIDVRMENSVKYFEEKSDIKTERKKDLEIRSAEHNIDGNYLYTTGRVKNLSDKTITYFKIRAEYVGVDGTVLDYDYTNSGENLKPGYLKEFEIMHKNNSKYDSIRLYISEVKF